MRTRRDNLCMRSSGARSKRLSPHFFGDDPNGQRPVRRLYDLPLAASNVAAICWLACVLAIDGDHGAALAESVDQFLRGSDDLQRHRLIEWLKFLRQIDRETPKDKALSSDCRQLPRTNTQRFSSSWPSILESLCNSRLPAVVAQHNGAALPGHQQRLCRGVFTDVDELVAESADYVAHHNTDSKPFIRTKSARDIFQKVIRASCHLRFTENTTLR